MTSLRIGTRSSPLALWQAHHVASLLRSAHPGLTVELVEIQTEGDKVRDVPLAQIGGEGVFTKAIQQALLEGRADVAVHSLKDLPTFAVEGLILAAVPGRGPVGDVLVVPRHPGFAALPQGARIATSSIRRRAQILHQRPDLCLVEIRGNVETRLRKLADSDLDGLILAQAGLERLGLEKHITEVLDPAWMLPAVGQGALGLECRLEDQATRNFLAPIDDPATHAAVVAERAFLRGLGGGCQVPIGTQATHAENPDNGEILTLRGVVLSPDGRRRIEGSLQAPAHQAESLGQDLAAKVLHLGAGTLLNYPV